MMSVKMLYMFVCVSWMRCLRWMLRCDIVFTCGNVTVGVIIDGYYIKYIGVIILIEE